MSKRLGYPQCSGSPSILRRPLIEISPIVLASIVDELDESGHWVDRNWVLWVCNWHCVLFSIGGLSSLGGSVVSFRASVILFCM